MIKPKNQQGFGFSEDQVNKNYSLQSGNQFFQVSHGFTAIAAITSCTNTSNPTVMIAAGLVARKAVEKGLKVPSFVKTSLAPGSRVVTEYLTNSGLMNDLEALGFHVVGYGCTTCIGNSGPLLPEVEELIKQEKIVSSAVLSGNRNFEGRVNPYTLANYLASPPLVVVYALAGKINIDLSNEPLGFDSQGNPVFLSDVWPTSNEIQEILNAYINPELFKNNYRNVFSGNQDWNNLAPKKLSMYAWDEHSTYLQEPPYFNHIGQMNKVRNIDNAHALVVLGDSVTTDHISPAGAIPLKSPAGEYLLNHGVNEKDFNSYGSRRGNDRIMTRGTFGNIRLKNLLVPGIEGGMTRHIPTNQVMTIYDASKKYKDEKVDVIVMAGKEYGSGSSRDWAAKGPMLLGVKAVIAESFERIHRSNLVGMGILPLEYLPDQNQSSLGLTGEEKFNIQDLDNIYPGKIINVEARKENGEVILFQVKLRIDTLIEVQYFKDGGIMNTILIDLIRNQ